MPEQHRTAYSSYKGGPANVGDPDCRFISELERGNVLSKFIYEKLLTELCETEWRTWRKCIANNQEKWFTVWSCRSQLKIAEACEIRHVMDPEVMKKLEDEYLEIRARYRRTGIGQAFMEKEKMLNFLNDRT